MDIKRVAVVTGTAHGMGSAIAESLLKSGHTVHGVDRDQADLSNPEAVKEYFQKIGQVDILVNCAGGVVGQTHKPLDEVTDDAWKVIFDANLQTTFLSTRAVIKGMKSNGWGRIVNISSGAGRSVSLTGIQAYATAKAAQIGFTRQMAHELGQYGITVNCIAPGLIRTDFAKALTDDPVKAGMVENETPLRRIGEPDDIGGIAVLLASAAGKYITGQTIVADGGMMIR